MSLNRRPSAALVVACVALAVALGGTGYAAVVLPANSVGTAQLRNGAVVAAKVKPHSLLGSAFKPGQIPAGPKGDSATKLFASVKPGNSQNGLVFGPSSGTTGGPGHPTAQGVGIYTVTFNQDVSNCAVLAIPGGSNVTQGEISTKTSGSTVTVQTFDSQGDPDDLNDFTVAVFC